VAIQNTPADAALKLLSQGLTGVSFGSFLLNGRRAIVQKQKQQHYNSNQTACPNTVAISLRGGSLHYPVFNKKGMATAV